VSLRQRILLLIGLAVAVSGAYAVSLVALALNGVSAAFWPMNAALVGIILRLSNRGRDRLLMIAAAFVCMGLGALVAGLSVSRVVRFALSNDVEVGLAVAWLWREKLPLVGPRAFARFLFGPVIVAPFLAGQLASFTSFLVGVPRAPEWPLMWAAADSLGMLVVGPVALNLNLNLNLDLLRQPANLRRLGALAGSQFLVLTISALIFALHKPYLLALLYPAVVVAALAEPELGGLLAVVSFATVGFVASRFGHPLPATGPLGRANPLGAMQYYLTSLVFTSLPVTALVRKLQLYAAELETRRREAEELNAVKTKLLAHVSHEIRSPLSGVTSLAQLISDGVMGELTPQQRDGLAQIAQSGAEVEALARDLLDAATIQSGKASVHLVDVDVEEAVETAVTVARFRAKEFGGSVVVVGSYAPGLRVAADRLRMRQILINLIVNGLKYGGRPPLVQVAAFATGTGAVRFEVSDNGSGVSAELRNAMFRSFDRLGAEKSDIEGAGLGLALSRELAQLQGGSLGVEDGDLGGACFWLELPVWRAEEDAAAA
jgi:signal transduction histidine kinase